MKEPYNVTVECRKSIRNGYMLKVHFNDLGMYVDGWRVTRSSNSASGWWFQPPARMYNGSFIPVIEFDKKQPFWVWLEQAAIRAIEEADNNVSDANDVAMPTDEELEPENIAKALDDALEMFDIAPETKKPDPWREL